MSARPPCAVVTSIVIALLLGASAITHAQTSTTRAFEAASIRRNTSSNAPPIAMLRGDRFLAPNTSVRELVRVAYLMEDLQVSGGPGWIESDRFAIEATAGAGVSADDARAMLRRLLADRFKLATHTEKRDLQGFVLASVGRGKREGLRPSGAACAPIRAPAGIPAPPPPPPPPAGSTITPLTAGSALSKCGAMLLPGYISARAITIEQLATYLSRLLRKPVLDRTNITGAYDIDLTYLPEFQAPGPIAPTTDAPSVYTALQEQLGLKLDAQRVPTDVIVIDRIERPSEN